MFWIWKWKKWPKISEVKEWEFDLKKIWERSWITRESLFSRLFRKKVDETVSLPQPANESKEIHYDWKLEKYIGKWILLDWLLRKEFSMKELNAFFLSYINNLEQEYPNFEWFSAFIWHWKQSWAMVHLLNLLIELKYWKIINTFQADIWEVWNFETEIWSHNLYPQREKAILFDYRNDMAAFSSWILWTKIFFNTKYDHTKIIDTFLVVNHLKSDNNSPLSILSWDWWRLYYNLDEEVSKMDEEYEVMIEKLLEFNIELYHDYEVNKDLFYNEQFYKNFNKNNPLDKEVILNDSHILITAAILLYKEILSSIDLENKKEIYLNYPNNLEFSLVYFIWLLIKKDFPNLDIITDKDSLSSYISSKDYDENNILDIKIFNNKYNENNFSVNVFIDEEVKMKNTFSIYNDKVEVKI